MGVIATVLDVSACVLFCVAFDKVFDLLCSLVTDAN